MSHNRSLSYVPIKVLSHLSPCGDHTLGGKGFEKVCNRSRTKKLREVFKRRGLNLQLCPKVGHSVFSQIPTYFSSLPAWGYPFPRPIPRTHWKGSGELVHPVPRIWEALIIDWLVVNNYTRVKFSATTSKSHHLQRDFKRDAPKLVHSATFWCCEQPAVDINNVFKGTLKELKLYFKRWGWWLCDLMAVIVTPCVVSYSPPIRWVLMLPRF